MDFMRLLKSLEELLYELVSWLLFYPLTLWRCLRHPIQMMKYAETELGDDEKKQYDDALSPPIFLLITLFFAHLIELKFGVKSTAELPSFLKDEQNMLVFRAVAFSLFPLLFALQDLLHRKARLTRETLKPTFYSQSYISAPFVLAFDLALIIGQHGGQAAQWGTAIFVLGLTWFCAVQIVWQRTVRSASIMRAVVTTLATFVLSTVSVLAVLIVTALSTMPKNLFA